MSELRILPPRDPDLAAVALLQGLASTPDDFEHPEHELLAALVDGTLAEADREWVEGHLEFCPLCKEDVADLAGVRAQLADVHAHATAPRMGWLKPAIAIGTVAAGLALVVWWGGRTAPVANTPVADVPVAVAENQPDVPPQIEQVLTEDERAAVARALASGRVVFPPSIRLLRGQSGTLLGPTEPDRAAPAPQSPVGMATSTPRPAFAWRASEGATGYTVAVFDERFRKVAESGTLTETTWTPQTNLPRGRMLAWQVTAHLPDGDVVSPAPPQPEARFVVLTTAETAEVTAQRERLANEPIALGLVLARLGLFDDAESVLRRALDDSRFNRTEVQSLIASLERRGR